MQKKVAYRIRYNIIVFDIYVRDRVSDMLTIRYMSYVYNMMYIYKQKHIRRKTPDRSVWLIYS